MSHTSAIYSPLSQETLADPHSVFEKLLRESPVFWHDGMQSWVVSSHRDCREVLKNNSVFARDPRRSGKEVPPDLLNIQKQDPPAQAELRRKVMSSLHEQDLAAICRSVRNDVDLLIEARRGGKPFDLMSEIAGPAAMTLINRVLGISELSADQYYETFRGLTRAMDAGVDPSRLEAGAAAGFRLNGMMERWISAGTSHGSLAYLSSDPEVQSMPVNYVRNTLSGVFNAGFSTAYATTGSTVLTLLQQPDVLARLADPSADRSAAAHEFLRYISPAQATARTAVQDTELSGVPIAAGETVITLLAAANRDPAVFDKADQLILDRWPNPHLAFAYGPHVCLGSTLAIFWIQELFGFCIDYGSRLQLEAEPEYLDSATLRSLVRLSVSYN